MTIQPFTLSWAYRKQEFNPVADEAGFSRVAPQGTNFVKQLRAALKSQTLYSRGAMLTSLSLLAACGGSGGGTTGGTPSPSPTPTNTDPAVATNAAVTGTEDTRIDLNFSAPTDADGDTLTITVDTLPTGGTLFNGTAAVAAGGTLTTAEFEGLEFEPDAGANGSLGDLSYTVSDGNGGTATQAIAFSLTATEDGPPVVDTTTTVTGGEDADVALGLTAPTDPDPEQTLTITVDSVPGAGQILNGTVVVVAGTTLTAAEFEALIYRPDANDNGTVGTFVYTVEASGGGGSTSQTVTIEVTGVDDGGPTAATTSPVAATLGGAEVMLDISAPTDPDPEQVAGLTITVTGLPTQGIVQLSDMATSVAVNDVLTPAELEGLVYVAPSMASPGAAGSFTYSVSDGTTTVNGSVSLSVTSAAVDLDGAALNGTNGYSIAGAGGDFGASVAGGADINGDGIPDYIIGAPTNSNAFVVFGDAITGSTLDVATELSVFSAVPAVLGFIVGGNANTGFGTSVAIGGDLNGDGEGEFAVGAPLRDNGASVDAGESFVIFGGTNTVPGFNGNLTGGAAPDGTDGFIFISDNASSLSGSSVAFIGDVNGDGQDDIAFGLPGEDVAAGTDQGQIGIVFGQDSMTAFDATITNTTGQANSGDDIISGISDADMAGATIVGLGDINGDGTDDFAVGAPEANGFAGATYVIFGDTDGDFDSDFASYATDAALGFTINGTGDDELGQIAGNGDFNGDGINDILIGIEGSDGTGGVDSGSIAIIYGRADSSFGFGTEFDSATDTLAAADGTVISGVTANGKFGSAVASIGDFNGDSIDDFAVTASGEDSGDGAVYVIFGRSSDAFEDGIDLSTPDASSFVSVTGGSTGLGRSITGTGDIGGTDNADLLIGADNAAYVLYGYDSEGGTTVMSTDIIALDDGIVLPDSSPAGDDDLPPLDGSDAASAAVLAGDNMSGSAMSAGSDLLIAEDIDLSGVA